MKYGKFRRSITASVGALALAGGLVTGAWGQAGVGGAAAPVGSAGNVGGPVEGGILIKGTVVCVDCTLEEARKAHPDVAEFYQLTRATPQAGRLVMKVNEVNNDMWWKTLVGLSHEFPVRVEESVWRGLVAEANLYKEMQISGTLRKTRLLDINTVEVGGETFS